MTAALLSVALLVAACGGDSKDEGPTSSPTAGAEPTSSATASPEVQAYFDEMAALAAALDTASTPIFETLNATDDVDEAKATFARFPDIVATFISGMEEIEPPPEVVDQHEASISAGEAYLARAREANDQAQEERIVFRVQEAVFGLTSSQESANFSASCRALQARAVLLNAAVDLGCGP